MTKKQSIWLVVALVLFAVTGYLGVTSAARAREQQEEQLRQYVDLFMSSAEKDMDMPDGPFLALVRVEGTIVSSGSGIGLTGGSGFDLDYLLDYVDSLIEQENNVGILLYVNSPGGEMNAGDELYLRLMDYKEATGRPIYCYFDDLACSGGYYVAMASDEIWANRNSTCVNIGVYMSTYNYSELFGKLGIEQIIFKSSENKGIGMGGVPWTEEQKGIYQSMVDIYYQQFLDVVAKGRGMTPEEVRKRDDGREMLAVQALEAGFIDGICRYEEYVDQVLAHFDEDVTLYEPAQAASPVSWLFGALERIVPKSDAQVLREFAESHQGMVVMAYAQP